MNPEASECETFVAMSDTNEEDLIPSSDGNDLTKFDSQAGEENFCKTKYAKRVKSRDIDFQKLSPVAQRRRMEIRKGKLAAKVKSKKKEKLDPHVFEEVLGYVGDRINDATTAKKNVEEVINVTRQVNEVKASLKYKGSSHDALQDNTISRLEDLIAFIAGISSSANILNFFSILHLYLRSFYSEPMTLKIIDIIRENFSIAKEYLSMRKGFYFWSSQGGEDEVEDIEKKFDTIKSLINNWKTHKSCDLTKHVCNTVNILVTFGFFPELKENPLEFNGFKIFQAKAWDVQEKSVDFTEMVLETAVFFLERGYVAFKAGDLSLLLYDDANAIALEKEYALLISALPLLESGRLEGLEKFHESIIDQQDYELRVAKLDTTFCGMLKTEKSPHMRNTLTNKLVVLGKVRASLILCQKSSCIREKPFGVLIHGGSAVGKSMVNSIVLKVLLNANGFNSSKEHVITLNDSDKFQSEYRAHHTAVTMDDFGNTKSEHYDGSPTVKIIDFLNNVPKAALNPNVELKGNIMVQPKFVSVTTNVKTLLAPVFSNEPVSILRRFNVVLDVFLREEYEDPQTGGPDETMMAGKFIPDAWVINVEVVKIVRRPGRDTYEFKTLKEGASIFEALDIMMAMSATHFESQKSFVSIVEDFYELELCKHSFPPKECHHCGLDAHCFIEPLGSFDTDDPVIIAKVSASIKNQPSQVERLQKIIANWYIDRQLEGAINHVSGSCDTIMQAFEKHKREIIKATVGTVAIASTLYAIHRIYKTFNALREQSCETSIPIRVDGDEPSVWKQPKVMEIPKSLASSTTTWENLSEKIAKHIGHVYIIDEELKLRRRCDILPMCNNFWLVPSHLFEDKQYTVQVQTTPHDVLGKNFTQIVGPENWARIPDTDFLLICLTSGGDVPNFGQFLPLGPYHYPGTYVESIWKSPDGGVDRCDLKLLDFKTVESNKATFQGVSYHCKTPTFLGQCMMTLISRSIGPVIVGFHLAGKTGESYGAAGVLFKNQLDTAMAHLRKKGVLECHSSGDMITTKYDIDFTPCDTLSPKSAVNYLSDAEDGTQPLALVFGAHPLGTRTFRSNVNKTPISDSVFEHMGLPRIHGKPVGMNTWMHWQRDLALMSIPRGLFRPDIMKQARNDFKNMVTSFFQKNPEMLELVHPYAKDAVLAGIDGVNSVDRIDLNTSMGFPVNKQKKNFIHDSERKVPGISCPLEVEDQYWHEVLRMEKQLENGERIFTVFRGNLKDEPTKFTKNKVRVFAGCEFAFLCLTRKYFLSIIRVIQSNWDQFECAVGINAHGADWTKLAQTLTRYGDKRMIAGDYAAFDKCAAPEAMLASFDQLIHIAELAGYTERQLCIMRGIATEISLPVYEYDGVIVQMFGSNPSGHSLTVIINNIMNSLYLRYAYYVINEGRKVPVFSDVIALMCYGDDNAMGVHESEKQFNHTRVSEELAKIGVKYTMADKEAESVPYITFPEVSFLKRSFVWNEDVKQYVAPIEIASISKSLHNFMKRKGAQTLPDEIAGNAIKNAQREFFRHGRSVCTERTKQLAQVRDECNLNVYVGDLPTYDEAVVQYLDASSKCKRSIMNEPEIIRFD